MGPTYRAEIARRGTRFTLPISTMEEVRLLYSETSALLVEGVTSQTWDNRASAHLQLQAFYDQMAALDPGFLELPEAQRITSFLTLKLRTTLPANVRKLLGEYQRIIEATSRPESEEDAATLSELHLYEEMLVKRGALVATHQAPPLTNDNIETILTSNITMKEKLNIWFNVVAFSRAGDTAGTKDRPPLPRKAFKLQETTLTVDYTVCPKSPDFPSMTVLSIEHPSILASFQRLLDETPPETALFDLKFAQINKILRDLKIPTTSHGAKRRGVQSVGSLVEEAESQCSPMPRLRSRQNTTARGRFGGTTESDSRRPALGLQCSTHMFRSHWVWISSTSKYRTRRAIVGPSVSVQGARASNV